MENWLCLKKPSKKLQSGSHKSSLTYARGSHARYGSECVYVFDSPRSLLLAVLVNCSKIFTTRYRFAMPLAWDIVVK